MPHSLDNLLAKGEQIAGAASHPLYAPALAARGITTEFIGQLLADIAVIKLNETQAAASPPGPAPARLRQAWAVRNLLEALHEVQAAARQKYERGNPLKLQAFLVGTRLPVQWPDLERCALALMEQADQDALPGLTLAKAGAVRVGRPGGWRR
jgi:hypothetical protein